MDCRARERPGRRLKPGPARVEPARGRPDPREQSDSPGGLRPVHGRGAGRRRARARGPRDRRLPVALRTRRRTRRLNAEHLCLGRDDVPEMLALADKAYFKHFS